LGAGPRELFQPVDREELREKLGFKTSAEKRLELERPWVRGGNSWGGWFVKKPGEEILHGEERSMKI